MLQLSDSSVAMEKHGRSESPNDEVRQSELNRMASIRLHQKLVQSHDKQWHAGPEVLKIHKIVMNTGELEGAFTLNPLSISCGDHTRYM